MISEKQHGQLQAMVYGWLRSREKGKGNKARANTRVETAAQATPEGATEMGWKTNQGHRGDSAAAHLHSPPLLHLTCYSPSTLVVTGINRTKLVYLQKSLFMTYLEPRVCCNFIPAYLDEGQNQSALAHSSQSWSNNDIKLCWINWNPTGSMLETSSHSVWKKTHNLIIGSVSR